MLKVYNIANAIKYITSQNAGSGREVNAPAVIRTR